MTNRELFHATMRGENGDKLLYMEQGFNIPHEEWIKDGMPPHVQNVDFAQLTEYENLYDHTNVSGHLMCRFEQFCVPPFEMKILEEKDGRRTVVGPNGDVRVHRTDSKPGTPYGSIPHEVDFAFKTLRDYEENRFRLVGNIDKRYDKKWLEENKEAIRNQGDFIVALWVNGPFAFLRELMGTENAMVLPYIEPDMIKMMLDDHLKTSMEASEPVIKALKPDIGFVWEDCCGSTGPFISPSIFEEFMAPWYRAWKDYLVSMGVNWITLDTDGDPSPLVRLWYENGVDCMEPWEVNSVDMLKFAEEYPQYVMMGGIYKHMFEPDDPAQVGRFSSTNVREAINEELERVLKPMKKRGKYIASLDHWPFWNVKYNDYLYFQGQLESKYGKSNRVTRNFLRGPKND